MSATAQSKLSEALLEKCRERAPMYDRENRFCQEDFDELKAAGYLQMAIPREFGGFGMTLAEVGRETRRLAEYAPATALCINMHNYWVGVAADVWRSGDKSRRVDPAGGRRRRSLRSGPCGERQRNFGLDVDYESRACARADTNSRAGNRSGVSRPCGHAWVSTHSIQAIPPLPRSSMRLCRATRKGIHHQGNLGCHGHAGNTQRRHDS